MRLWMICYDISDTPRRRRIVAALSDAGAQRVQESVFEGWLDEQQRRLLERAVALLIRPQHDSVVCYRLGGTTSEIMIVGGQVSADRRFVLI